MSNLDDLRALDGSPHSREFRRELVIAILATSRRLGPVQRRLLKRGSAR